MSLQTFCQNCGTPNYYTSIKPKLCNQCGQPFAGAIPALAKKTSQARVTTPKPASRADQRRRKVVEREEEPLRPTFKIESSDDDMFDLEDGVQTVPDLQENPFRVQNLGPSSKVTKLEIVQNEGKSAAVMPHGAAQGNDGIGGIKPKAKRAKKKPTRRKPKPKSKANKSIYDALKMKKGSAKENSIQVGASK